MPLSGSQEFIDSLLGRSFPRICSRTWVCLLHSQTALDPDLVVDVIDVRAQCEVQMVLKEFVECFISCPRTKLLNMLSLEFSQSNLSTLVQPPHVVSELSLITNCWIPEVADDDDSHDAPTSTPSVQKYCLLSMAGSYTDFHIDFGGSSVWYHVVWGEKTFYLIPPTQENLLSYWKWSWSPNQRYIFLPDVLHKPTPQTGVNCPGSTSPVYRLQVLPGQTILLPSGWIHAVYTSSDCLVFGGNFLNELHIPMQLRRVSIIIWHYQLTCFSLLVRYGCGASPTFRQFVIVRFSLFSVYRMEQKSGTPRKFQFPNFEKVHWFAADQIVGRLTNVLYDSQEPKPYELDAARCLSKALPRWLEKRRSLPLDERCYYLPDRSTMELSCPQLIDRLHELVSTFDLHGRGSKKTQVGILLSDVDSPEESAKLR
ncbi:lysine-specific demethylase 7A [Paragonimus westermani]|uniref:Lysine-specific demethylase 7A n=1 Tax=Paragonimus westermani TaxID=34504 RepID=A0A5J4NIV4_9TREM|nr:lysine-specific demethylase 7A [Paragonimus westermani]